MKKVPSTIYDIAARLNVTPSTVSRALSDHPRISTKTKEAVRAMAAELNYQQNKVAAALRSGKTKILGVVVPTIDRSFFSALVRGIEQVANSAGYNVMITQSNDSETLEKSNIDALVRAQVDGVIASLARDTEDLQHFENLTQRNIPLILCDRVKSIPNANTVVIDDFQGAYKAVEHLIEQGCRRIAHLTGTQRLNIYKHRLEGYKAALQDHNIEYEKSLVIESKMQLEDGRLCMEQLLALDPRPDAVFASSDLSLAGAIQVLNHHGLNIPKDLALVGFANELFPSLIDPQLSSVNQYSEEMGQMAAKIFLDQIATGQKNFVPRQTVLMPKLLIRQSSSIKK
ncbi:MAG: LacI family DNA-binding transcriptional regulator [Bacteroidota bacterium]